jgi:hypothetical protein
MKPKASSNKCCTVRSSERPDLEVADIFKRYGDQYRASHKLTPQQHSVMFAIQNCRTGYYGFHVDACDQCNYVEHAYNSCRNRHCPKCQAIARRKWVTARVSNLLPVPYYHTVFTLPHIINPLVPFNKRLLYEFIFDCASQTLLQFGQDPKWLGAQIGFYGILHSWGGKLWQHLHLHFIVPAGGIGGNGQWVKPKYNGKFFFPVHAVSQVFRGKFIEQVKRAYYKDQLVLPDGLRHLKDPVKFEGWIDALVARNWNVHIKPPFSSLEKVVRYIGRYTHKIAISNNRLIKIDKDRVHFKFKNYRNNGRWEQTSLTAMDFIARFLMHVVPERFHKIRHYGFLANGRCKATVQKIRQLLDRKPSSEAVQPEFFGIRCPICGKGKLSALVTFTCYGVFWHANTSRSELLDSS